MSLVMKGSNSSPPQWVINETDKPIYATWNGKEYIWDPHPSTAKKGEKPKMYALKPTRGEVERGDFITNGIQMRLKKGQGIVEGEKLVEIEPITGGEKVTPQYKHLCEAAFVREMKNNSLYDHGGVKKLTFTDAIVDNYTAALDLTLAKKAEVDAEVAAKQEQLKKLDAEIAIGLERARQLDAGKK